METATITHVLHYERAFMEYEYITLQIGDEDERRVYQIRDMTNTSAVIVHTDADDATTNENIEFEQKRLLKDMPEVLANLTAKRKDLAHQMLRDGWDMVSDTFKDTSPGINIIFMFTWTVKFQRG